MKGLGRRAVWVGLAALLVIAGTASADKDVFEIHVVAHEDAANCVADEAPCYEIRNQTWGLVEANDTLELTFENNASQAHALNIVPGEAADDDEQNTSMDEAFVELGPIEPGQTASTTATVPGGTETAYLFCHVGDHEAQGLNLLRNVYPDDSVAQAEKRGPGLDDPNESPTSIGGALVAVLVCAVLVGRRSG